MIYNIEKDLIQIKLNEMEKELIQQHEARLLLQALKEREEIIQSELNEAKVELEISQKALSNIGKNQLDQICYLKKAPKLVHLTL